MRFLHTSDWHLGRTLHEHSLLEDQSRFLDDLLAHMDQAGYDALVIAGDVFDRSVPSEEAVALWNGFLERFAAACPGTALVAIAGNHDSGARLAGASRVIERAGVHLRGGAERLEEPVRLPGADLWLIPFLWSGSLVREGEDGPLRLQSQEAALAEAVARIRARMDASRLNVLVAHCFAAGAEPSESERTLVGTAVQVGTELFAGFDYVALGHLHRPQALGPRVRYSGSPLAYSFSEAGQAKSLAAVTLAKDAAPAVDLVPITPLRPMVSVKGTLDELLADPRFSGLGEAYVRVVLTETASLGQPAARLRSRFPLLLELQEATSSVPLQPLAPLPALERPDLGTDFLAFQQRLRGEAPPEALQAAFADLRRDLEKTR